MMETILNVLDKQLAMSPGSQQIKGLSLGDNQIKGTQGKEPKTSIQKEWICSEPGEDIPHQYSSMKDV